MPLAWFQDNYIKALWFAAIRIHALLKSASPYLTSRLSEKIKNYSIFING